MKLITSNLIRISPFISLFVCLCRPRSKQPRTDTFWWFNDLLLNDQSEDLLWIFRCNGDANVTVLYQLRIRYTCFHWLIYYLKRSLQEVTRTCLKQGCVRSFHEWQKQTGSEMKGQILFRFWNYHSLWGINVCGFCGFPYPGIYWHPQT